MIRDVFALNQENWSPGFVWDWEGVIGTECTWFWKMSSECGAAQLLLYRGFSEIKENRQRRNSGNTDATHTEENSSVVSDCNAHSLRTSWWHSPSQEENQWRSNGRRYSTWLWQFLRVMVSSLSQVNSTCYPMKNGFPSFKGRVPHLSPFLPLRVSLLPVTLHSGSLLND